MKNFCVLVILVLLTPLSWAKHHIKYQISPLGNLVYQLDCITQAAMLPCSQGDFISLWEDELETDANDESMLATWKSERAKLNKSIEYSELPEIKMMTSPNFPVNASNGINILDQVRILAFATAELDTYQKMMRFWVPINYLTQEIKVLNHFWPRFETWFNQQHTELKSFVTDANALSEAHDLDGLLNAMRTFYKAELPEDLILPVYLIAHPKEKAGTSGLVFNENSLVEVLKSEKAESRLAVVVHEIAHFYHERASIENHIKHMNYFINNNSQTGKVGYYLFNEAMAAAIGNGLFEQKIQTAERFAEYAAHPLSFYNNEGIDLAAKAALELVNTYIQKDQAIDQQFMAALDKSWAKTLHEIKDSPQQLLRHIGLVILDEQYNDMVNEVLGNIRPSSARINTTDKTSTEKPSLFKQYPQLDTLILASDWQQIESLNIPGYLNQPETAEGIKVFTSNEGVHHVVIVSSDRASINTYIEKMLSWNSFKTEE